MDLTVNEYIEGLMSKEANERSCDVGKMEDLESKMHLPEWFDKDKYNQGRRFLLDFHLMFSVNLLMSLLPVMAIPSILKILVGTRRGNSPYTSYKRYISTLMHLLCWQEEELQPNTNAWRSLQAVRTAHLSASKDAVLKGRGAVSQRDMALTQAAIMGFTFLAPDKFGIRQIRKGDWEGYIHFWKTIGYMIGLEDRYNVCRESVDDTREVMHILLERVFNPCLENVPEYFEHSTHVLFEGLSFFSTIIERSWVLFLVRYYSGVPGYVYTETDRILFQNKLRAHLKGKSEDILGVDTAGLLLKNAVDGLPKRSPRQFYVEDFEAIDTSPGYKQLNFVGRYRLATFNVLVAIYHTDIGRYILNLLFRWNVLIGFYFPYRAIIKFGLKEAIVNMFVEGPKDDSKLKPNSEYEKPLPADTWYGKLITILW